MNERILNSCAELKAAVGKSQDFVELERLNDLINNSDEISYLSFLMNNSQAQLEYAQEKGGSKEEIAALRVKFSEAKAKLYSFEIVSEYHRRYRKVQDILAYLNKRVFLHIESECQKCE